MNPAKYLDLDKITVVSRPTLFEPAWESLKENRCPWCNNKLRIPRNGKIAFCNSSKHGGKSFTISINKLSPL